MKKIVRIYRSHNQANNASFDETINQTPEQRLAGVEFCRRQYFYLKGIKEDNRVKRVISIIKKR